MRVLCTGSRDFKNVDMVIDALLELPADSVIIHGGAKGLDKIVDIIARYLGFKVEVYKAEWKGDKREGLYRNSQMLHEGKPEYGLGFRSKLNSKGTNDMLMKMGQAGIPHKIYNDF